MLSQLYHNFILFPYFFTIYHNFILFPYFFTIYHNFILFPYFLFPYLFPYFFTYYETYSISVNPLFHAAIKNLHIKANGIYVFFIFLYFTTTLSEGITHTHTQEHISSL